MIQVPLNKTVSSSVFHHEIPVLKAQFCCILASRALYAMLAHCSRQAENHLFNEHHWEMYEWCVVQKLPLPLQSLVSDLRQQRDRDNILKEGRCQAVKLDVPENTREKVLDQSERDRNRVKQDKREQEGWKEKFICKSSSW